MKFLLALLMVGCGEVHGMPFGGVLPVDSGADPSGGTAGAAVIGSGGAHGTGSTVGTGGTVDMGGTQARGTGGATGSMLGTGGVISTSAGGGTAVAVGGGMGGTAPYSSITVELLPVCRDYVTEFPAPIGVAKYCGVSGDGHLLYGCVGVDRLGYPFSSDPCQFTDPNNKYNDSHVFGCVDARGC